MGLAARGSRQLEADIEQIEDQAEVAQVRNQARGVQIKAAAVGLVATLLTLLLP